MPSDRDRGDPGTRREDRDRAYRRSKSPSRSHRETESREGDRSRRDHEKQDSRDRDQKRPSRLNREDDTKRHKHRRSSREDVYGKERNHRHGRGHGSRRRDKGTPTDDEDLLDLKILGVDPISEDDYYVKSAEFKFWLQDSRDRDFTEMSSDQTRRYFKKFVRRWNDGALREKYYTAPARSPMASTSRWGTSLPNPIGINEEPERSPSPGPRLDHPIGPSLPFVPSGPSGPDRQLSLESQREHQALLRQTERSSTRRKALDRAEEIAPKLGGKEGKMAEKRAVNSSNREMRDKEVGGLEVDEKTLMGEGTSFQAALKARDAAAARKKDKRDAQMADARSANEDRLAERRQKDNETMQMLQEMARQRFG